MRRLLLASVLAAATFSLAAFAQDPAAKAPAKPKSPTDEKEDAIIEQERLANQYRDFETALLHLAQRLERSGKREDRDRAVILKEAIRAASGKNIRGRFNTLISTLKKEKAVSLTEVRDAMDQSQLLADDIRAILDLLLSDNRDEALRAERERIQQMLKELDGVIREQKVVRAQTEAGRSEKTTLGKAQEKVTGSTEKLARLLGKDKDGKGEPKAGDKSNPNKDDGKKDQTDKDKGDKDKNDKSGSKDKNDKNKNDQNKSDGKSGDKKDQSGKQNDSQKDQNQQQQGQKNQGQQSQGQQQPNQGEQQDGQKQQQDQQQSNDPAQNLPGKKQVQDAIENQKQAKKEIEKEKRDEASKKQDEAIKKLEDVRKRWEELLRQLRDEELERRLAALQARCEQMLALQIEVYEGTVRVDKAVAQNPDKKPTRPDEQRSLQLSDREQEIVRLADKALELLAAEGSAVAFAEVFGQVREDTNTIARRLGKVDAGVVTQTIEQDVIATLKDMIEALKRAQQDLQQQRQQQQQQQQQGQPPPRGLIDILAELKMIRSLQVRVNNRTLAYAKQYPGEQAADPEIQRELNNLAQSQQKIFDVTHKIAKNLAKGESR